MRQSFNQLHIKRPLHPAKKSTIGNTEDEPIPFRKILIESAIAALATVIIQEIIIMRMILKNDK
jgi:hypothetical protein